MSRATFFAYSNPISSAREVEFNQWYDEVHLPQILERVPGVVAARRFRLSDTQLEPVTLPSRSYLTVYEADPGPAETIVDVLSRLMRCLGDGTLDLSDALDLSDFPPILHVYESPM